MTDNIEETLTELAQKENWEVLSCPIYYSCKPDQDQTEAQGYLRAVSFANQNGDCPFCKNVLTGKVELHHCLISKADVRGRPDIKWMIHTSLNVLLVHHSCHHLMNRELSLQALTKIFPFETISNWYYSIPWKSSFRRLP